MNDYCCDCVSYNQPMPGQRTPSVICIPPFPEWEDDEKTVCLDACIATAIQSLWKIGIQTFGSCCGHNDALPSVVVQQGASPEYFEYVFEALAAVDERSWRVLSWTLVEKERER